MDDKDKYKFLDFDFIAESELGTDIADPKDREGLLAVIRQYMNSLTPEDVSKLDPSFTAFKLLKPGALEEYIGEIDRVGALLTEERAKEEAKKSGRKFAYDEIASIWNYTSDTDKANARKRAEFKDWVKEYVKKNAGTAIEGTTAARLQDPAEMEKYFLELDAEGRKARQRAAGELKGYRDSIERTRKFERALIEKEEKETLEKQAYEEKEAQDELLRLTASGLETPDGNMPFAQGYHVPGEAEKKLQKIEEKKRTAKTLERNIESEEAFLSGKYTARVKDPDAENDAYGAVSAEETAEHNKRYTPGAATLTKEAPALASDAEADAIRELIKFNENYRKYYKPSQVELVSDTFNFVFNAAMQAMPGNVWDLVSPRMQKELKEAFGTTAPTFAGRFLSGVKAAASGTGPATGTAIPNIQASEARKSGMLEYARRMFAAEKARSVIEAVFKEPVPDEYVEQYLPGGKMKTKLTAEDLFFAAPWWRFTPEMIKGADKNTQSRTSKEEKLFWDYHPETAAMLFRARVYAGQYPYDPDGTAEYNERWAKNQKELKRLEHEKEAAMAGLRDKYRNWLDKKEETLYFSDNMPEYMRRPDILRDMLVGLLGELLGPENLIWTAAGELALAGFRSIPLLVKGAKESKILKEIAAAGGAAKTITVKDPMRLLKMMQAGNLGADGLLTYTALLDTYGSGKEAVKALTKLADIQRRMIEITGDANIFKRVLEGDKSVSNILNALKVGVKNPLFGDLFEPAHLQNLSKMARIKAGTAGMTGKTVKMMEDLASGIADTVPRDVQKELQLADALEEANKYRPGQTDEIQDAILRQKWEEEPIEKTAGLLEDFTGKKIAPGTGAPGGQSVGKGPKPRHLSRNYTGDIADPETLDIIDEALTSDKTVHALSRGGMKIAGDIMGDSGEFYQFGVKDLKQMNDALGHLEADAVNDIIYEAVDRAARMHGGRAAIYESGNIGIMIDAKAEAARYGVTVEDIKELKEKFRSLYNTIKDGILDDAVKYADEALDAKKTKWIFKKKDIADKYGLYMDGLTKAAKKKTKMAVQEFIKTGEGYSDETKAVIKAVFGEEISDPEAAWKYLRDESFSTGIVEKWQRPVADIDFNVYGAADPVSGGADEEALNKAARAIEAADLDPKQKKNLIDLIWGRVRDPAYRKAYNDMYGTGLLEEALGALKKGEKGKRILYSDVSNLAGGNLFKNDKEMNAFMSNFFERVHHKFGGRVKVVRKGGDEIFYIADWDIGDEAGVKRTIDALFDKTLDDAGILGKPLIHPKKGYAYPAGLYTVGAEDIPEEAFKKIDTWEELGNSLDELAELGKTKAAMPYANIPLLGNVRSLPAREFHEAIVKMKQIDLDAMPQLGERVLSKETLDFLEQYHYTLMIEEVEGSIRSGRLRGYMYIIPDKEMPAFIEKMKRLGRIGADISADAQGGVYVQNIRMEKLTGKRILGKGVPEGVQGLYGKLPNAGTGDGSGARVPARVYSWQIRGDPESGGVSAVAGNSGWKTPRSAGVASGYIDRSFRKVGRDTYGRRRGRSGNALKTGEYEERIEGILGELEGIRLRTDTVLEQKGNRRWGADVLPVEEPFFDDLGEIRYQLTASTELDDLKRDAELLKKIFPTSDQPKISGVFADPRYTKTIKALIEKGGNPDANLEAYWEAVTPLKPALNDEAMFAIAADKRSNAYFMVRKMLERTRNDAFVDSWYRDHGFMDDYRMIIAARARANMGIDDAMATLRHFFRGTTAERRKFLFGIYEKATRTPAIADDLVRMGAISPEERDIILKLKRWYDLMGERLTAMGATTKAKIFPDHIIAGSRKRILELTDELRHTKNGQKAAEIQDEIRNLNRKIFVYENIQYGHHHMLEKEGGDVIVGAGGKGTPKFGYAGRSEPTIYDTMRAVGEEGVEVDLAVASGYYAVENVRSTEYARLFENLKRTSKLVMEAGDKAPKDWKPVKGFEGYVVHPRLAADLAELTDPVTAHWPEFLKIYGQINHRMKAWSFYMQTIIWTNDMYQAARLRFGPEYFSFVEEALTDGMSEVMNNGPIYRRAKELGLTGETMKLLHNHVSVMKKWLSANQNSGLFKKMKELGGDPIKMVDSGYEYLSSIGWQGDDTIRMGAIINEMKIRKVTDLTSDAFRKIVKDCATEFGDYGRVRDRYRTFMNLEFYTPTFSTCMINNQIDDALKVALLGGDDLSKSLRGDALQKMGATIGARFIAKSVLAAQNYKMTTLYKASKKTYYRHPDTGEIIWGENIVALPGPLFLLDRIVERNFELATELMAGKLVMMMRQLSKNRSWKGREIFNKGDPPYRQALDKLWHIAKFIFPPMEFVETQIENNDIAQTALSILAVPTYKSRAYEEYIIRNINEAQSEFGKIARDPSASEKEKEESAKYTEEKINFWAKYLNDYTKLRSRSDVMSYLEAYPFAVKQFGARLMRLIPYDWEPLQNDLDEGDTEITDDMSIDMENNE